MKRVLWMLVCCGVLVGCADGASHNAKSNVAVTAPDRAVWRQNTGADNGYQS